MPLIFYTDAQGNQFEADVPVGDTVMQGAVDNMIDGIIGECGGACVCATCHCYVDPKWLAITGQASATEQEMIDATPEPRDNSRLSCQIIVTEAMEGLSVSLPSSQY